MRRIGYGATTLPAVTEALTIDGDGKLAEKEAERLSKLIKRMTANLVA